MQYSQLPNELPESNSTKNPHSLLNDGVTWMMCVAVVLAAALVGGVSLQFYDIDSFSFTLGQCTGYAILPLLCGLVVKQIICRFSCGTKPRARMAFATGAFGLVIVQAIGQSRIQSTQADE